MKKIIALVLTALLALSLVACGSETKTDDTDKTEDKTATELTGTVSTDGSTSMEKVIGALSESFMAQNGGVTVTTTPPAPAPASPPCRRAPATSACPPVR